MTARVAFAVNDTPYQLDVEPAETLLPVLRYRLGLMGTKENCLSGECGVCTVLLDGRPVYSCLLLAVLADGHAITTVEGLARGGTLNPLQEAFLDTGAVQCGYCTPGMLMTATALLEAQPHPSEDEIRAALSGNLCRCTGYAAIVEAIRLAAERR